MKLKQAPEDFRVEELSPDLCSPVGEFAVYSLEKTGWTTPDAIAAIRRRWKIDGRRVSFGGLKDRHAVTRQHFSIHRGPERDLRHERIAVKYLGRRAQPFTAANILANRFTIVMRALSDVAMQNAVAALPEVQAVGVPNYFDDQRFGSVGESGEFVAKEMVFGRFEHALYLALAAPYEFDRAEGQREKQTLRDLWGQWPECKAKLPNGHARELVEYLCSHPTDFKGAVARLHPELQGLYLSAYQSELWNRMLAHWLRERMNNAKLAQVQFKRRTLPAPREVSDELLEEWEALTLPLPSARIKNEAGAPWAKLVDEVLEEEGLTLAELKVKGMHKPFFSKGERAGCIRPANLSHQAAVDDLNRGREKLTMTFELPRGCYATMVVKRITQTITSPEPTT